MNTKNKKDIVFGNFDLDLDEFHPSNVKVRITTMVDEDALIELKRLAKAKGVRYQTLLNRIIRNFVSKKGGNKGGQGSLTEDKVRLIVREELRKKA